MIRGGENISEQLNLIRQKSRIYKVCIVIGTPGRLNHLLTQDNNSQVLLHMI